MNKKIFSFITLALLSLLFNQISAEALIIGGPPSNKKLKELTVESDGEIDKTLFSYNEADQLVMVKTDAGNTMIDWSKFSKGEVSMEFKSSTTTLRTVFELDKEGRAVKAVTSNDTEVLATNYFTYDSDGYLININEQFRQNGVDLNPTQSKLTYSNSSYKSKNGYFMLTYDEPGYFSGCMYVNGVILVAGKFNLNFLFWPSEFVAFTTIEYGSIAGLLGKPIEFFPVEGVYSNESTKSRSDEIMPVKFNYEISNSGDPYIITSTPEEGPSVKVTVLLEE